ncbi:MAG TPA: RodZ domain-containing protein [Bryobacteraceae bacterium]|nr:RodZ domain-containing protein [Bryobacteraceae bacterium]
MMFSVGQRLRDARLDQGLDFATLAARTKISEKFLKAIEADDRKSFPSGFFYKSFVIQYAQVLAIDTREIEAEIESLLSAEAPLPLPGETDAPIRRRPPPLVVTSPRNRGRAFAPVAVLVVALLGCSGFYAWWRKLEMPAPAPQPLPYSAATETVQTARPQPMHPPAATLAQTAAVPVSLAGATQPDPPSAADAPQTVSGVLLELVARQATWLAVSSDGLMVFKGTLAPHESKTVEGKEFAKLRVNNPAALEVKLNGKSLGPLGPAGQYLVVVFTRDKYHVLASEKEGD